MSKHIVRVLAEAIKKSDTKIFFSDYEKQAETVVAALRKIGYEIVPSEASESLIDAMLEGLPYGRLEKRQMAKEFYELSIRTGKKAR